MSRNVIQVRVSEATKARWLAAVEARQLGSLTQLIVEAVERDLAPQTPPSGPPPGNTAVVPPPVRTETRTVPSSPASAPPEPEHPPEKPARKTPESPAADRADDADADIPALTGTTDDLFTLAENDVLVSKRELSARAVPTASGALDEMGPAVYVVERKGPPPVLSDETRAKYQRSFLGSG